MAKGTSIMPLRKGIALLCSRHEGYAAFLGFGVPNRFVHLWPNGRGERGFTGGHGDRRDQNTDGKNEAGAGQANAGGFESAAGGRE